MAIIQTGRCSLMPSRSSSLNFPSQSFHSLSLTAGEWNSNTRDRNGDRPIGTGKAKASFNRRDQLGGRYL